jgi:hypothetical protein
MSNLQPEPRGNASAFTLDWVEATKTSETIKWALHKEKFEIHQGLCTKFELIDIMTHCLTVVHKIDGQVGENYVKKLQSYKQVMPRTLSIPLVGVWNQVVTEYEAAHEDESETLGTFAHMLKAFFACHSTDDDRHELVSFIRYASKPEHMKVQTFFYRLKELNDYVDWLPGLEPALTDAQLNLAFYNGMPGSWRVRYAISGRSAHTTTRAELLHYFRVQEHEQFVSQQRHAKKKGQQEFKFDSKRAKKRGQYKNHLKGKQGGQGNKSGGPVKTKTSNNRVSPADKCPIHPDGNHLWGDCFQNIANKDKKIPAKGSAKKGKTTPAPTHEVHMMNVESVEQVSTAAVSTATVSTSEVSTSALSELVINESELTGDELSAYMLDSFNKTLGRPSTHLADLKKAKAIDNQKGMSIDSIQVLVSLDEESVTHHLNEISLSAEQQAVNQQVLTSEFLVSFTRYVDELYSTGDSDVKLDVSKNETQSSRLRSTSIAIVGSIQQTKVNKLVKVLFDSGSDKTIFKRSSLPQGIEPSTGKKRKISGVNASSVIDQDVLLTDITLPEFSSSIRIPGPIRAIVMDMEAQYDLIIGMDVMQVIGLDLHNSSQTIVWNDVHVPFKSHDYFDNARLHESLAEAMEECPYDAIDDFFPMEIPDTLQSGYKSKIIHSSLYEQVNVHDVASKQTHLTDNEQFELEQILSRYPKLFSGKLGCYPYRKVHLDLKPDAIPCRCRPYPVPRHHEQVFKEELARLCEIGVLERCGASQWLSPTFIIPKKDGRVRWITDFRKLNEQILRKVYNLPKIQDILTRRSGYSHFTKLDISMQYYTFELDDSSKELCTICTPFGNYRYNRLPMGVSQAPDISQEIMEDLFRNFNEVDVYIDDVGVFSKDWNTHCISLSSVLNVLETNEFTVNPAKCEWAVQETDWLGYWLTPVGLKPWKKKIAAILALKRPETVKQLRSFIGAVNFYRDMFPQRSHILAPLTALTSGKGPLRWSPECQAAFDTIKALLAKDAFLRYPDHNKRFDIYCDASDLQLGAAILQEGMPVAFYSRKLNSAQRNYTVGEKELLSIVETLKEFRTMLYGCPNIHVFTDHKNNTFERLQTQRVMRWRLFLDDYSVKFHYIKGNSNSLADALSRLPFDERQNTYDSPSSPRHSHKDAGYGYQPGYTRSQTLPTSGRDWSIPNSCQRANPSCQAVTQPKLAFTSLCQRVINDDLLHIRPNKHSEDTRYQYCPISEETHDTDQLLYRSRSLDQFQSLALENDHIDCFLHLPLSENIPFILTYANIAQAQPGDAQLQTLRAKRPNQYIQKLLAPNLSLWCYQQAHNQPWRIYLPHALLESAVKWYHHALSHVGQKRLKDTMSLTFYNPNLHNIVEAVVAPCAHCQRYKNVQRGHGATAPREADLLPWSHVAVDTIGPWVLSVQNRHEKFYALTIIDMVTNLTEIVRLFNRTSAHAATVFTNTWLARYPKPTTCIYDQGSEFIGWAFQNMLEQYDIQRRPTTVKNPQANAICERMHQAVGNSLRVLRQWTPPNHLDDAHLLVDTALANAMYATRATFHSGLMTTPGALSFGRDMVMNIPLIADLTLIRANRQRLIDERAISSNARRYSYDYQPGQEVLKLVYKPDKLEPRAQGPYDIVAVHTNGTLTIQLNAHATERISIRNVKPYLRN